jgi:hypothetical protein
MIAVPRCGEKLYPVADYTTTASTSVLQPIELILGQTRLTADDRGMLLQNPSWAILGDSISSIANEIVLKCPDRPVVDVLSTWEAAIGMMFSMLGPMRSASLVWKIYGTTEAIFETQQGEAYAFLILAGWFPGLCRYTAPSPSDEKTSEIGRCSLQIYRGPELYNILAAHLASIGWLPDAPIQNPGAPGPESYYCPPTRLGTIVRRTSAGVTGHHRWLCIEPIDAGNLTPEDTRASALSLAVRRGIRDPRVLVVRLPKSGEVRKIALEFVGLGTQPLAVVLIVDSIEESLIDEIRTNLLPYAAIIMAIGSGLRPRMDIRCDVDQRGALPPAFVGWQPFSTEHTYRPIGSDITGGGALVIVPAKMSQQLPSGMATHLYKPSSTIRNIVAPDDIGPEVFDALQYEMKEQISRLRIVVVIRDAQWRPILRRLMHFMKEPFALKFCT